ncbi:hypothetical protein KZY75_09995 [Prevotella salivae]|uniref:Uncharacterized protein n=2 Tax=Segatella salivae TaxID=228604 RepID=A0AAW4NQZ8_9BACT|nr:hypothetical protein [Segatella salivae]EFV05675.1 hypothetical protein HMPREF9420_0177 [Segatella salivae DSM 15606]MBW4865887.1 hypothetical protein [Segatella salivae]MBW4910344.1 hypothetical protein [Segatella salivae]
MRKESILKQVVLQEYGEKKHLKLTRGQFLLSSEFYSEVESMYKELGGILGEPPLTFGSWDISTPEFILELDEENHFNRYRLQTLNSNIYQMINGFRLDEYMRFCTQYESGCRKHGGFWKNNSSEKLFVKSDDNGCLDGAGSSRWRQRAFYDFLRDVTGLIMEIPVIRLSIYQTFKGRKVYDIIESKDKAMILDLVRTTVKEWV